MENTIRVYGGKVYGKKVSDYGMEEIEEYAERMGVK